jgi:RHS repeat-associated protein
MVAINKILLPERAGEGCGGDIGIGMGNRYRHCNTHNRAPATRNHRRTQPLVNNLYQGMTLDAVTGLYDERNRNYSPTLGRWTSQDPQGYINGANTYQFVNSSLVGNVDAEGTSISYDVSSLLEQGLEWIQEEDTYAGNMMIAFAYQQFDGHAHGTYEGTYHEILKSAKPRARPRTCLAGFSAAIRCSCPHELPVHRGSGRRNLRT